MTLPRDALDELKEIYKKEYGEELPEKDAQEMAQRLLGLFQLLRYKPRPDLTDSDKGATMDPKS